MVRGPLNQTDWSEVAAKAQAFLCLHYADMRGKGLAEQAQFLMNLGMSRADAAALLDSSDDSLRILMTRAAKPAKAAKSNPSKKGP